MFGYFGVIGVQIGVGYGWDGGDDFFGFQFVQKGVDQWIFYVFMYEMNVYQF